MEQKQGPNGAGGVERKQERREWSRETLREARRALRLYLSPRGAGAALAKGMGIPHASISHALHGRRDARRLLQDASLRMNVRDMLEAHEQARGGAAEQSPDDDDFWTEIWLKSDDLKGKAQRGPHDEVVEGASRLLPEMWALIEGGGRLPPGVRPMFVDTALVVAGSLQEKGELGKLALLLSWAQEAFPRIPKEEFLAYVRITGSKMDAETLRQHMRLSLKGCEACFYQNMGAWRKAWEIRAGLLESLERSPRMPASLRDLHRLGLRVGQLTVLPRIPRFSIREALDLIHRIREDLAREWPKEPWLPDPERMRVETAFYANRGLLMAYARYGGDWIREAERLVQINLDLEEGVSSPLLKCSFYRAWADYLWLREPPGYGESLEVRDRALRIADRHGIDSQRLKIAAEVKRAREVAERKGDSNCASLLQGFAKERALLSKDSEDHPLMARRG